MGENDLCVTRNNGCGDGGTDTQPHEQTHRQTHQYHDSA